MAQNIDKLDQVPAQNIAKINGIVVDADDIPAAGEIESINGLVFYTADAIPAGLIIPYTGGAGGAPAGWSLFSDANGKYIVGAGSTYAADENGAGDGSTNKAVAGGGHHGGGNAATYGSYAGKVDYDNAGNHTHTATINYTPPYQQCYLIKADSEVSVIPQNGVIFLGGSHGSLTNIWTDGYMFQAGAGTGTGGSANPTLTTDSAGAHNHGTSVGKGQSSGSSRWYSNTNYGSHSHSNAGTVTNNLYKAALAAYTDAASSFSVESGMIAMWQGAVAPTGWVLCDGTNGTDDLRDYFVKCVAAASAGGTAGTGQIQVTATFTHGNHKHQDYDAYATDASRTGYHDNLSHANHSFDETYTWMPPYYALTFIQKS